MFNDMTNSPLEGESKSGTRLGGGTLPAHYSPHQNGDAFLTPPQGGSFNFLHIFVILSAAKNPEAFAQAARWILRLCLRMTVAESAIHQGHVYAN